MGGACSAYGEEERHVQGFGGGNLRERDHLGGPRRKWEDNKMDFHGSGMWSMGWIELAQDRDRWRVLVNAVMNLRIPWNAGNFLTTCKPVSFLRRTLLHGESKLLNNVISSWDWWCKRVCGWDSTDEELWEFLLIAKYFSNDKLQKNDMGRACSTYRGGQRYRQGFGSGDLRERDFLLPSHKILSVFSLTVRYTPLLDLNYFPPDSSTLIYLIKWRCFNIIL